MSNSLKTWPFNFDLTSLNLNLDGSGNEVFPYKNLNEVISFYYHYNSGRTFPWVDKVVELQPSTDFCYCSFNDDCYQEGWFPKPRLDRSSVPKTLFCHDYKNGYLEDRFLSGSSKHDAYNFFNWTCVDIFVYFSHHFVTVPPPVWINAAHNHGVPILGTLITDRDDTSQLWGQILESEEKVKWFAETLALIAQTHKFEGYLLNIENDIAVDLMPRLMVFIKSLKEQLLKYKKTKSYVIWYDSITTLGKLKWQNELNYSNKPFFDISDGIFLNYSWAEQNLDHSKKMAGERIHDVFVGVDVFGRNMFGGGGYNTKIALDVIRKKNLSCALFAFGWTDEKTPGNVAINDQLFWSSIFPYFYTHGTKQFPFKSNFNRGCGLKYFNKGVVVSEAPWFNISRQSYQYSYLKCSPRVHSNIDNEIMTTIHQYVSTINSKEEPDQKADKLLELTSKLNLIYPKMEKPVVEYTFEDAFNGGGCIRINPSVEKEIKHFSLFDCDIEIQSDWFVTTVMKSETEKNLSEVEDYPIVYLMVQTENGVMVKLELRHGGEVSYESNWVIRKYTLTQKGRILEIGLLINPTHRSILLGEIYVGDQ